jgi:D-glycero-alpha-D-manno-heptose 1-phosphate guanylyltransferase
MLVGDKKNEMKLLVLAGGSGSRLRSILPDIPKALAPVGDIPFLALQIENWMNQGIRSFVFLLHHHSEQIVTFVNDARNNLLKGCDVSSLIEPRPLDTGGAVAYAIRELGLSGDFFLANADTWLGSGVAQLSESRSPAIAVVYLENTGRYGQVQFDGNRLVINFIEKRVSGPPGWINAGFCRLHSSLFENWNEERFSLENQLFPQLVQRGLLRATTIDSDFIDIGIPADYQRFCNWAASGRQSKLCN